MSQDWELQTSGMRNLKGKYTEIWRSLMTPRVIPGVGADYRTPRSSAIMHFPFIRMITIDLPLLRSQFSRGLLYIYVCSPMISRVETRSYLTTLLEKYPI